MVVARIRFGACWARAIRAHRIVLELTPTQEEGNRRSN